MSLKRTDLPPLHLHMLNGKLVSPSVFRTYPVMLCLLGMHMEHYEPFKTLLGHRNSECGSVLLQLSKAG